jgi:hypothetical protein
MYSPHQINAEQGASRGSEKYLFELVKTCWADRPIQRAPARTGPHSPAVRPPQLAASFNRQWAGSHALTTAPSRFRSAAKTAACKSLNCFRVSAGRRAYHRHQGARYEVGRQLWRQANREDAHAVRCGPPAARVGEGGGIAPPIAELQADGATSLRQIAAGLDAKEYRLRGRGRVDRSR